MITSFLGDGAMILFGLPEAAPDDRGARGAMFDRALRQDRALDRGPATERSDAHRLQDRRAFRADRRLPARRPNHQHITATGDTVNVASRLMEVAASHDVRLALSDTLRVAAERTGARLKTGSLAGPVEAQIRGRSGSLAVWLWRQRATHAGSTHASRRAE
jgi:adenylate cyclase